MAMVVSAENVIVRVAPCDMAAQDAIFETLLKQTAWAPDRLQAIAATFLEKPYFLEPLGEGPEGDYSEEPLYRADQFDCVTYVDTVLALLYAKDLETFRQNMLHVRYTAGEPRYVCRTDWFTDLEWLPAVRAAGWIEDVTFTVQDCQGVPIAKLAETMIDKPNWYRVRPLKMLHRLPPVPEGNAAEQLLATLQAESRHFAPIPSTLSYLPLDTLFDAERQPDTLLFDQIPSGAVVIIVRPDWPIRDVFPGFPEGYGTNLNVSHLGIVVRVSGELLFYHASSVPQKVTVEPLVHYLQNYIDSPTIKGIHVEQLRQGPGMLAPPGLNCPAR